MMMYTVVNLVLNLVAIGLSIRAALCWMQAAKSGPDKFTDQPVSSYIEATRTAAAHSSQAAIAAACAAGIHVLQGLMYFVLTGYSIR